MFGWFIRFKILICLAILCALPAHAKKTENIVLISLDGVRWQEVFQGVDERFFDQYSFLKFDDLHESFKAKYGHDDPKERRKLLFPFLWGEIGSKGQLYGNRMSGSKADLTNDKHSSYPGYNEILTGYVDPRIINNDKIFNPNKTFLEWLNEKEEFRGKTAVFASWGTFPFIINPKRSKIFLNFGPDNLVEPNSNSNRLNQIQLDYLNSLDISHFDGFTYDLAAKYMKEKHPKVVYIAYGDTDNYAHDGYYDQYIIAAQRTDDLIRRTWEFIQSDPIYKDKTTLLITTDHGRGNDTLDSWQGHGIIENDNGINTYYEGDHEVWMAVIGPDTPARGEMKNVVDVKLTQIASTMVKFLGIDYTATHERLKAGEVIKEMIEQTEVKTE